MRKGFRQLRRRAVNAQEVAGLYKDGLTAQEIAVRFGTCKSLVLRRLDEAGVERRPKGWKRPEFRFWRKVNKLGSIPIHMPHLGACWQWQGGTVRGAMKYGTFLVNGKRVYAHRFAWELEHGPAPKPKCVLHACDNPQCVRASHLFLGTLADNNHDRNRKGRQARGDRMAAAKLSYQQADAIRWVYEAAAISIATLARQYGVGETTIANIIHGRTWVRTKAA